VEHETKATRIRSAGKHSNRWEGEIVSQHLRPNRESLEAHGGLGEPGGILSSYAFLTERKNEGLKLECSANAAGSDILHSTPPLEADVDSHNVIH